MCAIKLTQCGMYTRKISYPDIAGKALGSAGKKCLEISLSVVHFTFTIAQIAFTINGLKTSCENLFHMKDLRADYFGLIILAAYSPLAWVR